MPPLTSRRSKTTTDYVVIALAPLLIYLMISSLANFLMLVIYRGGQPTRVSWTILMFTLGTVGIARVAIEKDRTYSLGYAVVLGAVSFLSMMRFVNSPLASIILLAVIAYLSDWVVRDCTLIDEEADSSDQGLIDSGRLFMQTSKEADRKEPIIDKADQSLVESASRKIKSGQPGRSVLYLALAALPLYGLGQFFLRGGSSTWSRAQWLLATYLFAALALLVTTSFLGLRRYLRQRGADMPQQVSVGWIAGGMAVIALILGTAYLVPVPGQLLASFELPAFLDSPGDTVASQSGWGKDGADKAGQNAASTRGDQSDKEKEIGSLTAERGAEAGDVGDGDKETGASGKQQGGKQNPGEGGKESGGEQKGNSQPNQSQPNQSQPNQSQPNQSQPNQSQPNQSQPNQSQPNQSQPNQSQPNQSQPGKTTPETSKSSGPEQNQSQPQPPAQTSSNQSPAKESSADKSSADKSPSGEPSPAESSSDKTESNTPQPKSQNQKQDNSPQSPSQEAGDQKPNKSPDQTDANQSQSQSSKQESSEADATPRESGEKSPNESQSAESKSRDPAATENSSPKQPTANPVESLANQLPGIAAMIKSLIVLILVGVVAAYVWFNRHMIAEMLRRLFDRTSEGLSEDTDEFLDLVSTAPPRPFSAYRKPTMNPSDSKRAILITFSAMDAWCREAGLPRRKGETPSEFLRRVQHTFPQLSESSTQVIECYNRIVYGQGAASGEDLRWAEKAWQVMQQPRTVPENVPSV
ncbi:hypothetical protein Pla22_18780 [Rubripirellula amarantea]|uniref:Protein-glutamine gamma-glutamyltransferase-like C-terminal domain-containing protein n=1 Tax=Rubripirellula amarantea TaxID=2527999 RepID=A0A5C5WU49_9BACT|nr:DUF4129 domain-containing protein [Rubripirellula amarantea]TWT54237.1 hypothetical protein Pla22_18780 [Rubripirellula amarantea]